MTVLYAEPIECVSASTRSKRFEPSRPPAAPFVAVALPPQPVAREDVPHPPMYVRLWTEPLIADRPNVRQIQRMVARQYSLDVDELLKGGRTKAIVRPRQIAMYLAAKLTILSSIDIGNRFGGRDHTTVLHAKRKISAMMAEDEDFKAEVDSIEKKILGVNHVAKLQTLDHD